MAKYGRTGEFFRRLFLRHIGYKLIAIVCSLIFFYSFQAERMGTKSVSTDIIAIMEVPSDDYILVSQFDPKVAMKLEGPMSTLKELRGDDIGPLIIPIKDFKSKRFVFDESVIESLPKSVHVLEFYPPEIPLRFERRVEKEVPVVPAIEGAPPAGRLLTTPVMVTPLKVKIKGAESSMKKIDKWETQTIYVDSLAPGVHEVSVNLAPPKISHITLEEEEVTVKVEILYKMMDRWFRDIPLSVEGKEDLKDISLRPGKASVLLNGPEEFLRPLSEDQLYFFVEVTETELEEGGSFQKEVRHAALPEATTTKKLIPKKITLIVKIKPEE